MQGKPALLDQRAALGADPDHAIRRRPAERPDVCREPVPGKQTERRRRVGIAYLDDGARFLGEQRRHRIRDGAEVDGKARVTRKRHLGERDEQTAIGTVVVGEHEAGRRELADRREEGPQVGRIVEIGRRVAEGAVDLREAGTAEACLAAAEVDQEERRRSGVERKFRRQSAADIAHRREGADHDRYGGDHRARLPGLGPGRAHRQRVLADRHRDAERRTQLGAERADRVVEDGVLGRITGCRHPVGRQLHVAEPGNIGRGDVGDRLRDGKPGGRGPRQQGHRRTFADRHRLAVMGRMSRYRDRDIGNRDLPRPDERIATDQSGHGPVADRDQEALVGNGRQAQQPQRSFVGVDRLRGQAFNGSRAVRGGTRQPGRLAEQHVERHVDGFVAEDGVGDGQPAVVGQRAEHGIGAALPPAERLEAGESGRIEAQYVAFLGFVAPDLQRAQAAFGQRHRAQVDPPAAVAVGDRLGHGIRQATGTDVVDQKDRIVRTRGPAAVDDLLRAPLHLGVAALHGGKIECRFGRAARDRRGRAATQTDEHARAAEYHQHGADRHVALECLGPADVAEAAGEHDRLVIPAADARCVAGNALLVGAEVAEDARPAELVVERARAKRAVEHDLQGRCEPRVCRARAFPRLHEARNAEVGHRIAGQPGLRLRAKARGAFVADFAARPGRGSRKRRDGRRMVVRLHLDDDVDPFVMEVVSASVGIGPDPGGSVALDNRPVVLVGRQHAGRTRGVGRLDHREQRALLGDAVEDEAGIEYLVPAVL